MQIFEIASWCSAGLNLAIAVICMGLWRRWGWAWLIALGAGLLLEFVLYGSMPVQMRILLPVIYFSGIILANIRMRESEIARRFFEG